MMLSEPDYDDSDSSSEDEDGSQSEYNKSARVTDGSDKIIKIVISSTPVRLASNNSNSQSD